MRTQEFKDTVLWWSGGITSAVACKIALDILGRRKCVVVMIDTKNEDPDTYRFKRDCEKWYGQPIYTISAIGKDGDKYSSIEDIWEKNLSLNIAKGAICSTEAKRAAREAFMHENPNITRSVFGYEFDIKETKRAIGMKNANPEIGPLFPLLMYGLNKSDCIKIVQEEGIRVPNSYLSGFRNNNCMGRTGCVRGGIGYWQKMKTDRPEVYREMAEREHRLTKKKGKPVTMLKDQSKDADAIVASTGEKWRRLVFLEPNPDYPELKSLKDMKGMPVEPVSDCNGFCGMSDLSGKPESEKWLNNEE